MASGLLFLSLTFQPQKLRPPSSLPFVTPFVLKPHKMEVTETKAAFWAQELFSILQFSIFC
jgi:hypothetical protein